MPSNTNRRRFMILPLAMLSNRGIIGSSAFVHRASPPCTRVVRFMSGSDNIIVAEDEVSSHESNNLPQHTVTFRSVGNKPDISFTANDMEILRTACLKRGLVSPHNGKARLINCRGLGTCGTCAVEISGVDDDDFDDPPIEPPQRNNVENLRLNFPPHGSKDQSSKLRLACQVQIRGDVVVTKRAGFWGQAAPASPAVGDGMDDDEETMVDPSDAKTYFGELEYLLDRRSPQNEPEHEDSGK